MNNKRVLIIDDEEEMRAALSFALKRCGCKTDVAPDGESGLRCFEKERETYDLVITDVKMPRMSGLDVLKEIREIPSSVPVILITAYSDVNTAVDAMKCGAADFLLKPFSAETLQEVVGRVFSRNGHDTQASPAASAAAAGKPQETESEFKIVSQNPHILNLLEMIKRVAPSKAPVFIQGESGTGKELFARAIHHFSNRSQQPFIAFNCAAIPENLVESELFGHEKGAFTGATFKKIGKFELANKGTIFLDEITEMDINLQPKMLRVIQEEVIDRVGGAMPVKIDVRIVATTNRNIEEAIRDAHLREDLFYRLNVIPLVIPPLRERREDIPLLVDYFLTRISKRNHLRKPKISAALIKKLQEMPWRGNIRELENVIERAVLLTTGSEIEEMNLFPTAFSFSLPAPAVSPPSPEDKPAASGTPPDEASGKEDESDEKKESYLSIKSGMTVSEMEKRLIRTTLEELEGNRTKAAELLGISIRTLRNKLNEYKEEHPQTG